MKKLILIIIALITPIYFVYAQTHDSSFDNKSVRKVILDDANTSGTVTVQAASGNSSNTTATVPTDNATLLNTLMHSNFANGLNWTDAHISNVGMNWYDMKVFASHWSGGDHSGINWQSFGV